MRAWHFITGLLLLHLSGCGTVVPNIGEAWDNNTGASPEDLELVVKKKIFCELQRAIYHENNELEPFRQTLPTGEVVYRKRVPETWGVQLTLQFTVIENSIANPSATFIPGSPSFSLATGATLSSEATRIDKHISYYLVRDLQQRHAQCVPDVGEPDPLSVRGSSLLLNGDAGILRWLNNAMNVRASGVSMEVQQEVASYDMKFQVVTSGSISPIWTLERVTTGTVGGGLFSTKRDRAHQFILTFGPTKEGETTTKKGAPGKPVAAQPGIIAANAALAQEIGAAVAVSVRNALLP